MRFGGGVMGASLTKGGHLVARDAPGHPVAAPALGNLLVIGATGVGPYSYSSRDGAAFTRNANDRTTNPGPAWEVIWDAGRSLFVMAMNDGGQPDQVATSPDGLTWTLRTLAGVLGADHLYTMAASPTLLVSLFQEANALPVGISTYTSPDGVAWTRHARIVSGQNLWCQQVIWAGDLGLFVAVIQDPNPPGTNTIANAVLTSADGLAWARRTTTAVCLDHVAFGAGRLVAVGPNGAITSTDGITWADSALALVGTQWFNVAYDGAAGYFLAQGATGFYGSVDGVAWVQLSSEARPAAPRLAYVPSLGMWAGPVGLNGLLYSLDGGLTWAERYDIGTAEGVQQLVGVAVK